MTHYRRFLLFVSAHYYPCGGEADILGSFDTLTAARIAAAEEATPYCTVEILDMDERTFVSVTA